MPKINEYINTNNKKPMETVYELKDKDQIPSFEEFMKDYRADEKVENSYVDELENYDNIGIKKVGGPMYHGGSSSDNVFSIYYSFIMKEGTDYKLFFEKSLGEYSNKLEISGNLQKLKDELRKLENGEIKVVSIAKGSYEYRRNWEYEEKVKSDLREDIRKFEEMVRRGRIEYNGIGKEYNSSISIV